MASEKGNVVIGIGGDASGLDKTIKEATKRIEDLKKDLLKGFGAFIGFEGAKRGIEAIVDASIEAQNAVDELDTVLKSTGNTTGLTRDELIGLSAELEHVTTFGDEAVLSAETILARFDKIGKEAFPQATEAALNLSQALGQDLKSSALEIGRALQSPAEGLSKLRRAGVAFTDQQEAQVKALVEVNRVTDAQSIVLDQLEKQFGGSARAAAETFGGSLKALGEAFGDLLENPDGLAANTSAVKEFTETLRDPQTIQAAQQLTSGLITLFRGVADSIVAIVKETQYLGEAFARLVTKDVPLDDLDNQIKRLKARAEGLRGSYGGAIPTGSSDSVIAKQLDSEIATLEAKRKQFAYLIDKAPTQTGEAAGRKKIDVSGLNINTKDQLAAADKAAREAYQVLKANLDGQVAALKDAVKASLEDLDQQLKDNQISFAQATDARIAAQQGLIDKELEAQRALLAQSRDESERAGIIQKITQLEQERGRVAVDERRKQIEEEKALQDQLQQVATDLKRASGDVLGADFDEIDRRYKDLLARLKAEGDTANISLVEKLIGTEKQRAQITDFEKQVGDAQDALAAKIQNISNQREAGFISERQASEQIIAANLETADSLDAIIAKFEVLGIAAGDPKFAAEIEKIKGSVIGLRDTTSQAAKQISDSLRSGFETAFSSILDGTKSVKDAFKDLLKTFLSTLNQIAAKSLTDSLFGTQGGSGDVFGQIGKLLTSSGSGGNSGPGFGAQFADLVAGLFHSGGIVGAGGQQRVVAAGVYGNAPRYKTGGITGLAPDEIPAVLHRGEEVLTRGDPRHRANGGRTAAQRPVMVNITTPNLQSFLAPNSQGQVSSAVTRVLQKARRDL